MGHEAGLTGGHVTGAGVGQLIKLGEGHDTFGGVGHVAGGRVGQEGHTFGVGVGHEVILIEFVVVVDCDWLDFWVLDVDARVVFVIFVDGMGDDVDCGVEFL